MEMVIANWQVSVHRAGGKREKWAAGRPAQEGPALRAAHRVRRAHDYEQKREQVHRWLMLHGGR